MNLSTEKKEHINSTLNDKCLGAILPILETGQLVCKEFMNLNNKFFDCADYLNVVPGHLLSYSINRQIFNQRLLSSFPFKLEKEMINKRNKYCIPILKKDTVSVSLIRSTNRMDIMDRSAKTYLKSKCIKNNELNSQISLFDESTFDESTYHGILLYGAKKNGEGIKFADIVFFDSKLKYIYYYIDLMDKLRIYESSMNSQEKEKNLLNAKNIIKSAKNNSEG